MEESPVEHFEHAEHAEHAAESGDSTLLRVSMTIALLAVMAATVGSLETLETAATFGDKNQAVLMQAKASDAWNFFQAKSMKKNIYALAAEQGGDKAADFAEKAKKYEEESRTIEKEAHGLEEKVEAALHASEKHENRHHLLTIAVTLLHVSIAVATISIIMRGQRWPWYGAILLGGLGALGAGYAYL